LIRVDVRRVAPDEWQVFREVRLAALADAPYAYLTTLAEARAQPPQLWQDRIAASPHFLATVDGVAAGITVVITTDNGREIVAVWVAPGARGGGVIEALIDAAVSWAREQDDVQLGCGSLRATNGPNGLMRGTASRGPDGRSRCPAVPRRSRSRWPTPSNLWTPTHRPDGVSGVGESTKNSQNGIAMNTTLRTASR
jgi:GNAT superfamily N-acetyltransferase